MALSLHSLQFTLLPLFKDTLYCPTKKKTVVVGSIAMESTKFRLVSASFRRDLIGDLGPVHAPPEEFVNAALFLRLGLTSTLIRHEIAALFLRS